MSGAEGLAWCGAAGRWCLDWKLGEIPFSGVKLCLCFRLSFSSFDGRPLVGQIQWDLHVKKGGFL